jgi:hypothetical protein
LSANPYAKIAELAAGLVRWFGLAADTVLTWQVFGDRGANADGQPLTVTDAAGKPLAATFAARANKIADVAAHHCRQADFPNVYLTFGLHDPPGRRKQESCRRVLALTLDCDACDWLAAEAPGDFADTDAAKAYLRQLDSDRLEELLAEHRAAVAAGLTRAGLPAPSAWWGSGYGCYCLYALAADDEGAADVDLCRAVNRDLVDGLDFAAGYKLADPAAKDAGTRVLRAPGAFNVKRPDRPLPCVVLSAAGTRYTVAALRAATPAPAPATVPPDAPPARPVAVDHAGPLTDEEVAREALRAIPADDYGEWIGVGKALHALGYSVAEWEAWSATSAKYKPGEGGRPSECAEKWPGFAGGDRPDKALGYLVKHARNHGSDLLLPGSRRRTAPARETAHPAPPEAATASSTDPPVPDATDPPREELQAMLADAPPYTPGREAPPAPAEAEGLEPDTDGAATPGKATPAPPDAPGSDTPLESEAGPTDEAPAPPEGESGEKKPSEPKQSTVILRLAEKAGVEPFRTPDGGFWLAVPDGDCQVALPLGERGGGVTRWLTRRYADAHHGSPPSSTALAEAAGLLNADAEVGPVREVHLRIAEHCGRVYLDLGRPDRTVAEVDAEDWRLVPCPRSLYFRRGLDTAELPDPARPGAWKPLTALLDGWLDEPDGRLAVAWLLAALRPGWPFYALAIYGEQESGKTMLARLLRYMIDPAGPAGRGVVGPPKDEDALKVHAASHHVCAWDNLSHLPADIADNLCRLATGAGISRRRMYTDNEESLVYLLRPIIVNGIAEVTTRPDLLSRFVSVTTRRPAKRRTEADLWREAKAARPQVLGALLTAASAALRHADDVAGAELPRMADAGQWLLAAEWGKALPWPVGTLAGALAENQANAQATAAEASPLTAPLLAVVRQAGGTWHGTADELRAALHHEAGDRDRYPQDPRDRKEWPQDPTRLSAALTRLGPALRESAVADVARDEKKVRRPDGKVVRTFTITILPVAADDSNSGNKQGLSGNSGNAAATGGPASEADPRDSVAAVAAVAANSTSLSVEKKRGEEEEGSGRDAREDTSRVGEQQRQQRQQDPDTDDPFSEDFVPPGRRRLELQADESGEGVDS